jgi:hypothetical protein
MVRKIRLETIEQNKRHSTALAGDYFHLAINWELRVDSIQQEPQHEPKVLVRLRNLYSSRHMVRRATTDKGCQVKTKVSEIAADKSHKPVNRQGNSPTTHV